MKRESEFTHIYSTSENGLKFYVRLAPNNLCLSDIGFPHGISVSLLYDTKEEAIQHADAIDLILKAYKETLN